MDLNEEGLVMSARQGDTAALSVLMRSSRDAVFNLAVRMLGDVAMAEDATQEVLIRAMTGLSSFRGESSFRTWVYRIAANHLLSARRSTMERMSESLDAMATEISDGLKNDDAPLEDAVLVGEAKLACTSRMMLGLDRDHRLAFILGEILEVSSDEGAAALDISPEAYRKRLSRSRERMARFVADNCGVADPQNACRCGRQVARMQREGRPLPIAFSCLDRADDQAPSPQGVKELDAMEQALGVIRSHPKYRAPERVAQGIKALLDTTRSELWK